MVRWTIVASPDLDTLLRNDIGYDSYLLSKSPPNLSVTDSHVSRAEGSSSPERITSSAPKALAVRPRCEVILLSLSLLWPSLRTDNLGGWLRSMVHVYGGASSA